MKSKSKTYEVTITTEIEAGSFKEAHRDVVDLLESGNNYGIFAIHIYCADSGKDRQGYLDTGV